MPFNIVVVYIASKLQTGGEVCGLWLPCFFKFQLRLTNWTSKVRQVSQFVANSN